MSLKVAFQMDPMESLNFAGDSTFAMMLEAQARGHQLFHYLADALSYEEGRVYAEARSVRVERRESQEYELGDLVRLDLGRDVDMVWMRQDPPFDIGYITATYLLERLKGETLVLNDPASVRDAPEKLFVLDFARFMPATLITRSTKELKDFHARHRDIVVKPLHGKGGEGVFRVGEDGRNMSALAEMFGEFFREPFIAQAFLPAVKDGDKRIVLVDGEVAGAINRIPGEGEFRSNLAAGGRAEAVDLTDREREICDALKPELQARGLLFVGIDVIGGMLTEINVTSPTGIVAIDKFNGTNIPGQIWDASEAKVRAAQ